MDYQKILRDLHMKSYKPAYLLSGEEPYFIDLITDYIEANVLDETERVFGQHIVYGMDVSMQDVVSMARSFPMAGERQLVMVKESQEMKEWKKSENLLPLEQYLQNPSPNTLLVFTMKGKKPDKRWKVSKLFESKGVMLHTERLKEYQMPGLLTEMAKERGIRLDPSANTLLVEYLGTHLSNVANALNKLRVVLPEGTLVTTTHIEEYIGISKDYNTWELQKALGTKDILKANRIIDYFIANPKENPLPKIVPNLFHYFSKLAAYEALKDKSKAQTVLKTYPSAITEMREAEKKYSRIKLDKIVHHLRDADRRSKGIDVHETEDADILKELVFKILH